MRREQVGETFVHGTLIVSPHSVAVPLNATNGDRYVAHVLPLASRRMAARALRAGAAVFVHKAALGGLLPLEAMARQLGLSPAELRVQMPSSSAAG